MITENKHWEWMPGMWTEDGLLVVSVSGDWMRTAKPLDFRPRGGIPVSVGECATPNKRPDLDHPATQGCIEHGLLPEQYGTQHVRVYFDDGDWWLAVPGRDLVCLDVDDPEGARRGDALRKALEAAP